MLSFKAGKHASYSDFACRSNLSLAQSALNHKEVEYANLAQAQEQMQLQLSWLQTAQSIAKSEVK